MKARMVIIFIVWLLSSALILSSSLAQSSDSDTTKQEPSADKVLPKEATKAYKDMQKAAPANVQVDDSAMIESEPADTDSRPLVYTITIEGAIGVVTDQRIEAAIETAEDNNAELLVIYLNTPGGFTKPTWSICSNILNSRVPVAMYIAPRGAKAGSAGVYMTYASHIAAMAPSTNLGAAHPVSGSGEEVDSVMNEKITNDAVAQIKAAAKEHGRNVEWAEKAVRESVSIDDREALELGVVEYRADDLDHLLAQLEGKDIKTAYQTETLSLKNRRVENIDTSWWWKILDVVTQPDIALILFSLGSLGLLIELYNPGGILPGVVGAICLILAFYSFQALPINYAGLALIVLAIILFIAEIKVVSHGILTIGGLVSFFFGGLMLIDTVDPNLRISTSLLVTIVVCIGVIMAIVLYLVVKAHRHQVTVGDEGMIGKTATVRSPGMVYVDGALWRIETSDELKQGDKVIIEKVTGLTLQVKKL